MTGKRAIPIKYDVKDTEIKGELEWWVPWEALLKQNGTSVSLGLSSWSICCSLMPFHLIVFLFVKWRDNWCCPGTTPGDVEGIMWSWGSNPGLLHAFMYSLSLILAQLCFFETWKHVEVFGGNRRSLLSQIVYVSVYGLSKAQAIVFLS